MSATAGPGRVITQALLIGVAALVVVAGAHLAGPADASQPGDNGRIWWVNGAAGGSVQYRDGQGPTMTQPSSAGALDGTYGGLAVSKDGTLVAFVRTVAGISDIWVSANGSDPVNVTPEDDGTVSSQPSFCGDGTIVYGRSTPGSSTSSRVWAMGADGSGKTRISAADAASSSPSCGATNSTAVWAQSAQCPGGTPSSSCSQLANAGGLIPSGGVGFSAMAEPDLSPDGTRVAFIGKRSADSVAEDGAWVVPVGGGVPARMFNNQSQPTRDVVWAPDGTGLLVSTGSGNSYAGSQLVDLDPTTADAQSVPAGRHLVWSPATGGTVPSPTPTATPTPTVSPTPTTGPPPVSATCTKATAQLAKAKEKVKKAAKAVRAATTAQAEAKAAKQLKAAKAKRAKAQDQVRDAC